MGPVKIGRSATQAFVEIHHHEGGSAAQFWSGSLHLIRPPHKIFQVGASQQWPPNPDCGRDRGIASCREWLQPSGGADSTAPLLCSAWSVIVAGIDELVQYIQ